MVSLWNYSPQDEDLFLTLYHQAGQYKLPIHLPANASVTISLASLIKSGKPDTNGNTIPPTTVQGSAKLSGPRGDMDTIDVAMHSAIFNVRTGTCTCCCSYCNYVVYSFLSPGDLTEGVGEVTNECVTLLLYYDGCPEDISGDMNWDTSSGTSTVATVDENGDVTGVGPGTTTITGSSADQYSTNQIADCNGYPNYAFCSPYQNLSFSAQITVQPNITSISKSARLWFFGTGITPSGYNTSETLTAVTEGGFVNGTYVWTVTTGTSKVTLANSSSTDTVTNTTTMGLSSTSFSTSANDVTVQVQYTSPDGTVNTTKTVNLDVDSPYQLATGTITDEGLERGVSCDTPVSGNNAYLSFIRYEILSKFGTVISGIGLNEQFNAALRSDNGSNNWPNPSAGGQTSSDGTFADVPCVTQTGLSPSETQPSGGSTEVFHIPQTWFVGSTTVGSGISVQTDNLKYYTDHARHVSIVSPTR